MVFLFLVEYVYKYLLHRFFRSLEHDFNLIIYLYPKKFNGFDLQDLDNNEMRNDTT